MTARQLMSREQASLCSGECNPLSEQPGSFPLACASEGERVRIVRVRGGRGLVERLQGIGIRVNDVVEVVQRQEKGAVLVALEGIRVALGGGMAMKINVSRW